MPFAATLRESLQFRQSQISAELTSGEDLEQVLSKHLLAVEAMAEGELITSILLLSTVGKHLRHGAGPRLPQSYRQAIDGSPIGPAAGSCGTAAYLGRPIYVSDIANDPLWAEYRHLALPHDLRSCWSTPIHGARGEVIGTFAIYRRTVGHPTEDEIDAIRMITNHVAEAIILARDVQDFGQSTSHPPQLRLVIDHTRGAQRPADATERLLELLTILQSKAAELDRMAESLGSDEKAETLRAAAQLSRKLVVTVRSRIDEVTRKPFE